MTDADPGPPHVDLGGYVLGTLDAQERETFERHLAGCLSCRRELEELRGIPALLDEAGEPVEVPVGLESRVLEAIGREQRPGRRRLPLAGTARSRWARPPRSVPWALGAAAALVIAFVAGLGLGHGLPTGGQPAPPAQTVHLVAADGGAASGLATIRSGSGGRVIELTVRDLPPPPAGRFYTCWLVADDDTIQHQDRVSVGSFTTSPGGTATVRWETAADLARYPHLGVTLEPDNGNPLHQGPKVLTASS
jgi:anti-sigma-K factor RskA